MTRTSFVVMSIVGLCATAALAQDQHWAHQFGTPRTDDVWDIAPDGAGGVIVGGYTYGQLGDKSFGAADVFLARFDADGVQLWVTQFGTAWDETPNSVSADGEGGVFLAGWTQGSLGGPYQGGDKDGWVGRYNADGEVLWIEQIGTAELDWAWGVAADGAGGVYVTGWTEGGLDGANAGGRDAFVARYDGEGVRMWLTQVGTEANDNYYGVATDGAGGVFVSGSSHGDLGGEQRGLGDAIIAHYDADGTQINIVQFGTPQKELAKDLVADGEGGVFTSGYTKGDLGAKNQGEGDAFVARYDSSLKEVWTHQIGTSGWDEFQGLLPDGSGGVFAVADTSGDLGGKGNAGDFDAVIARFNEQGLVWIEQFGTPGDDSAKGPATDGLGGVFVGGYTTGDLFGPNQGSSDAFIFHFADGCDPCDANCDGSVDLTDVEAFIKLLFGGDPCDFCTGDANDDGSIDLTDVEPFIACLLG